MKPRQLIKPLSEADIEVSRIKTKALVKLAQQSPEALEEALSEMFPGANGHKTRRVEEDDVPSAERIIDVPGTHATGRQVPPLGWHRSLFQEKDERS